MKTPAYLEPNVPKDQVAEGLAVLMQGYNEPHIAFVKEVSPTGILITETNFKHGKYTERFLTHDDPHIRGYWRAV